MGRKWLIAFLLAGATFVLYCPAHRHEFVNYDDPLLLTDNAHVKAGLSWARVVWAFKTPVVGNWHPVTNPRSGRKAGSTPWS